jgi:hypothetical protein
MKRNNIILNKNKINLNKKIPLDTDFGDKFSSPEKNEEFIKKNKNLP